MPHPLTSPRSWTNSKDLVLEHLCQSVFMTWIRRLRINDFANGLLPDCNDAKKTIAKLERSNINHFWILHNDTGLYACSKCHPNKDEVRIRLDYSAKIQADLEWMRGNFILNGQSKMLVMISMATNEMIRLMAMYPDVWFMDTTAG